jgi:hypothetical protein
MSSPRSRSPGSTTVPIGYAKIKTAPGAAKPSMKRAIYRSHGGCYYKVGKSKVAVACSVARPSSPSRSRSSSPSARGRPAKPCNKGTKRVTYAKRTGSKNAGATRSTCRVTDKAFRAECKAKSPKGHYTMRKSDSGVRRCVLSRKGKAARVSKK